MTAAGVWSRRQCTEIPASGQTPCAIGDRARDDAERVPGQPPIITVAHPGPVTLPVGDPMGARHDAKATASPRRAAGLPPIMTVIDPRLIMPGPPGIHVAS